MFQVFLNVVFPIFILVGFGVLLERTLPIDVKSVSRVTFYVLSPCLIFSSLVKSTVSGADSTRIFAFVVISMLFMWGIGWLLARLLRLDRVTQSAFLLTMLLINAGNYGLPVNLFAFGEAGLERAALFFVGTAVLSNTVGVFLAARGEASSRKALLGLLKVPMLYAALSAFLVNIMGFTPPAPLQKAFTIAGNGAVPIMLLILGMELSRSSFNQDVPLIILATVGRLIVAAGIAWALAAAMGLQGVTRQVCIVESSMPTAVTAVILAVEFDTKPRFVTSVIFLSTLASMITLTVLLSILM